MTTWRWTREEWFSLPLDVRQRWWRDTDYSKREPSLQMLDLVARILHSRRLPTVIHGDVRCERCGAGGHVVSYAAPFPALCLDCFMREVDRVKDKTDGTMAQITEYIHRNAAH